METPSLIIHSTLESEIRGFLPKSWLSKFTAKTYNSDAVSFFKGALPALLATDSYCVVFIPGSWCAEIAPPPNDLLLRCVTGLVRFVAWKPTTVVKWTFPHTVVPEHATKELTQMIINKSCRLPAWGLHTCMPINGTILTERIYSKKQFDERIDMSASILTRSDSIFTTVQERIVDGLKKLSELAFAKIDRPPGSKPFTFQMGIAAGLACHSLRWHGEMQTVQQWLLPSDEWKALINAHSMTMVQVALETEETELTLINLPLPLPEAYGPRPYVVDTLTWERLAAARNMVNDTSQFQYGSFG